MVEMNYQVSGEEQVSANTTAKRKMNLDFERKLFRKVMEHRVVEEFYDYAEMVKSLYGDYNATNHCEKSPIGFEYKKDIRAEWVKYIVDKFSITDEQVICEVENYYYGACFVDNFDLLRQIEECARNSEYILNKKSYNYATPADVFLAGKLDIRIPEHMLVSYIVNHVDAYRNAMEWGVVECRGDIHISLNRFDGFDDDKLAKLIENELEIKKLVFSLSKIVGEVFIKKDEIVVYIVR